MIQQLWYVFVNNVEFCSFYLQDFVPRLRSHLLHRLHGRPYDGDESYNFTDRDHMDMRFSHNRLYRHKVLRLNYTTYDLRRDQDSINPRTGGDIMLLSHEDTDADETHCYWYARIVAIFHVEVFWKKAENPTRPIRMPFLLIRWLGKDLKTPTGWKARRLHRVGFVDGSELDDPYAAFGFLDPEVVIRAVHLIPAFRQGFTTDLLPKSIARRPDERDEDALIYYVGM